MKRITLLVLAAALVGIIILQARHYVNVRTVGNMTVISFGERAALLADCLPPVTEYPITTE